MFSMSSIEVCRYIEAPDTLFKGEPAAPSIFLAGGITGCPDWQARVREMLRFSPVTILNPRRADFDMTNDDLTEQQVSWEYKHLHQADVKMFWFPGEQIQPIALFELGSAIGESRLMTSGSAAPPQNLVIGAHPYYPRRKDIQLQLNNAFGVGSEIADTLEKTVAAAVRAALGGSAR